MMYTSGMARAYQEQLLQDGGADQPPEQMAPRPGPSPLRLIGTGLAALAASIRPRQPAGETKTKAEPYATY